MDIHIHIHIPSQFHPPGARALRPQHPREHLAGPGESQGGGRGSPAGWCPGDQRRKATGDVGLQH